MPGQRMARAGCIVPAVLLLLIAGFTLAQQAASNTPGSSPNPSSPTNTTNPNSAANATSPNDASNATDAASQNNNQDSDQQPKVFIIHHHYGDPQDLEQLAKRLQPVDNGQGDIPAEFNDPNYPFGGGDQQYPPGVGSAPEAPADDAGRFDPLGQYSDGEKKRQFYQDLLMNQLNKFESEFEPMIEKEQNVTIKNDMEEVMVAVNDLKKTIQNHQIFNITQLMDDWKQGRLAQDDNNENNQPNSQQQAMPKVQHHYHFRPRNLPQKQAQFNQYNQGRPSYQDRSSGPSQSELLLHRPPPVTRTYWMMPQRPIMPPAPTQMGQMGQMGGMPSYYNPYPTMYNNGGQPSSSPMVAYYRRQMQLSTPAYQAPTAMYQRTDSLWARAADGDAGEAGNEQQSNQAAGNQSASPNQNETSSSPEQADQSSNSMHHVHYQ